MSLIAVRLEKSVIKLPILLSYNIYVSEHYFTQKMCDKVVDTWPFVFNSVPDRPDVYKTQKMCDEAVSEDLLCQNIDMIDIRLKKCVMKLLMIFYQH